MHADRVSFVTARENTRPGSEEPVRLDLSFSSSFGAVPCPTPVHAVGEIVEMISFAVGENLKYKLNV